VALVTYTWQKKVDAVTKYMSLGNMRLVSELVEVPYDTLHTWRKQDWWMQLVEEIRVAKKAKTNQKLTDIIDTSLEIVMDRLENGDFVLNQKTGEIERKPVSVRDASTITNNLLTRQIQMEEMASKADVQRDTIQETLKILAKEFSKWNNRSTATNALDVKFKELPDAIHEGRGEGLQEGSGEVHEQAGSEEEESGTECSETADGESWQGS
jgi:hypothetical protein